MRIQGLSWFLLFQILFVAGVSSQCLDDQRLLLLQLKSSLVFNSSFSTKLVNWNQSDDCCKWDGIDCDGAGRVIGLNLENQTISGGIENSTALFRLQYLEKLNLALNLFNNALIPKGLQNLTSLEYLNLSNAGFGGQIPIEVSTLRSLVVLDLSNLFDGAHLLKLENPNLQMLVKNLPRLRGLYLDNVNISAQRSDWCQALSSSLPDLRILSLRRCGLLGPLDSSLAGLHSLSVLRLDMNDLSTVVPEFFANFSNFTTLTLHSCLLQGTFPDTIFQVPTLQTLDLSINRQLSGTIPQFPVNSSLKTMLLSYTNFSGQLPDTIRYLQTLSQIDLSNCNFTGVIPSSISSLTELVHLDFSVNSFNGSIPLFNLSKKLAYIDLSGNSLTGSLSPMHFEGLSSLANIYLVNNFLEGRIPRSLFSLPSLQKLQLSNNKFSGQIDAFSSLNHSILDTLDLSGNQLEGSIPDSFFTLEKLNVLVLSWNLFNGTIELEKVQKLPNLTRLELGYNKLSVATSNSNLSSPQYPILSRLNLASCNLHNFPDLRNQSKLTFLDLSRNSIKGELPSWIWDIGNGSLTHLNLSHNLLVELQKPFKIPSFLGVLDLHSNSLRGEFPLPPASAIYVDYSNNNFQQEIPVSIGDVVSVALFFSLANNGLIGAIPTSLCNATYLQVLDLSDNNLSGSIPSCLVNIPSLGVLNLRRNKISGHIPDSFSYCGLQTLDLSQNDLEGKIPLSMANCKSLEVMNVGNNKIDDTFPCSLKNSSSLRILVLRNNKFHGDLGCSEIKEGWPNLQIIDIASNRFTGELYPTYFASWRGMILDNNAGFRGGHLGFNINVDNFYYQDTVTVTLKGLEVELVKILAIFTAIDFSGNKFSGEIPQTLGDLSSLYLLNLSHNAFTGEIPNTFGRLRQLGSMDLSANNLSGEIPKELTKLNFLSVLNLSYNKLVGMIPTGSQFQTFSASSFEGNSGLCGFPLNKSCDPDSTEGNSAEWLKKREYDWQLIITGLGYGVGLVVVFVPVALFKPWRKYYSEQLDQFIRLLFPGFIISRGRRRVRRG